MSQDTEDLRRDIGLLILRTDGEMLKFTERLERIERRISHVIMDDYEPDDVINDLRFALRGLLDTANGHQASDYTSQHPADCVPCQREKAARVAAWQALGEEPPV